MNVADIVANFVPGVQLFISIFDIVPPFLKPFRGQNTSKRQTLAKGTDEQRDTLLIYVLVQDEMGLPAGLLSPTRGPWQRASMHCFFNFAPQALTAI